VPRQHVGQDERTAVRDQGAPQVPRHRRRIPSHPGAVPLRERRGNAIPAERSERSTEDVADHQAHDRPRGAPTDVLAHGGEDTYDASVRIALGLLFVILGLAALSAGSFSGGFGDKDLWWLMVGGAALFFGVGMLLRGAIRMAIWALAAVIFVVGGGLALFRNVF
jgi:hypothetical protein